MTDNNFKDLNEKYKDKEWNKIVPLSNLPPETTLEIIPATEIISKRQPWFWPAFIPNHTVSLFAGRGGVGKSALLIYMAAKTSTGETFNACGMNVSLPKGRVILMNAEDDMEYQLKPKLLAAGADCSMIDIIKRKTETKSLKKRLVNLQNDLYLIERYIEEKGAVKLIVIDPVNYFIGDLKEDKSNEVIPFIDELKDFSKIHNLSIILNKHLRKGGTNSSGSTSAANEISGSHAWVNSPRITWVISNDHEDKDLKIISNPKNNLFNTSEECLAYRIKEVNFEENGQIFTSNTLEWETHTYKRNADDALNKEQYNKSKQENALDFIFNHLKENGVSLYKTILDKAIRAGISERQMRNAKSTIKIKFNDQIKTTKAKYSNGDQFELID